eukprot:PLAT15223.1.p1 GENE.PLAT15223.1~~PLAT15223.1.p1  ORF type:complete len:194 (+),score=56.74 PLAT15223.1:99-680(+)
MESPAARSCCAAAAGLPASPSTSSPRTVGCRCCSARLATTARSLSSPTYLGSSALASACPHSALTPLCSIAGEFKSLQALLEAAAEQLRYPVWTPAALAAGAVEGDTFDPATSSATVRKVVERRDSADGVALLGARPLVSRGLPSSLASIGKSSREGEDESSVLMMEGDEESNILMDADDGLGGSFGDDVMLM